MLEPIRSRFVVPFVVSLGLASARAPAAQSPREDAITGAHVQDLVRLLEREGKFLNAVWMPAELIELGAEDGPPPRSRKESDRLIDQFNLFFVAAGTKSSLGGLAAMSEEELLIAARLVDAAGRTYRSLPRRRVPADVEILAASVRANSGVTDELYRLVVFPALDESGEPIGDPREEGSLTLRVNEVEVSWELPLGSFLPPKSCPVDGKTMSGDWRYCPWHGVGLDPEARKPSP
jgi:hypothetical protein